MTRVPAPGGPRRRQRLAVNTLADLAAAMGPMVTLEEAQVLWVLLDDAGLLLVGEEEGVVVVEEMSLEQWQVLCVRASLRRGRGARPG